jgi:hypothetical protein
VGIGFCLFLFVVGAILTFAVDVNTSGFSVNTVGIILMVGVAVLGAVLEQLLALEPAQDRGWRGPGGGGAAHRAGVLATRLATGSRSTPVGRRRAVLGGDIRGSSQ